MNDLGSLITEKNAKIANGALPSVWADRQELGRVLQNLIENALKYGSPNRTPLIHVSSQSAEGTVVFSVKDNGRGIPRGSEEKIFELFHRSPSQENGSGIGLAACRKIVARWGGRVWAESVEGEGSTFFVEVPLPPEPSIIALPTPMKSVAVPEP